MARNAESLRDLLRDRRLLIFAACVVLFHLSNAAMLNLAAGEVTAHMGDNVQLVIAACIIVPQFIVAALSPWVGRQAQRWGRRPVLILGFCALPLRALLFAGVSSPYLLVPVQMLDGISAAVFGVMLPLIAADVAGGKGRYNLCIGFFGLAAGIGATLSTAAAGFAADRFGTAMSFFGLAAAGALAAALVWLAMPETRDAAMEKAVEEPAVEAAVVYAADARAQSASGDPSRATRAASTCRAASAPVRTPSDGCASRAEASVYGAPAFMMSTKVWIASSPSMPWIAAPRISFVFASTSAFMKPSVSPRSRARPTRAIGIVAIRASRPSARTSLSLMPTRANGGSTKTAYVMIRPSTLRRCASPHRAGSPRPSRSRCTTYA